MTRLAWLLVAAAACSRGATGSDPPPPPPRDGDALRLALADARARSGGTEHAQLAACERIPFATSLPLAEASGAVWMPDGSIIVVSDSGNDAAYVTIDGKDGRVLASGKLPLGGGGDDLEGLTAADGLIWAITSSGWMRAWKPRGSGEGYALEVSAYRIDPEDECAADAVNCGNNYEGLCLEPGATAALGGCAGFAAAKTSGELVCLVADEHGRYVAAAERRIRVAFPGTLAACDIAADGTVWTGENLFGRSAVRRVVDGAVVESAFLGEGFPEAMARAPDGTIYRFSDTGGAPSRVAAYRCGPAPTKGASPADGG